MKKRWFLVLTLALVSSMFIGACGKGSNMNSNEKSGDEAGKIKVGFIFLHDEKSTYDLNFINAAHEACANMGLSENDYIIKTKIPEGQECYDAAASLAEEGCDIIFANSFGHEDYMIQAAYEYPNVQFCHATGTKAHTEGVPNFHNAFASIYEGRYLSGVAMGLKLNDMIEKGEIDESEAKVGYVGAFRYAEVISGYTAFFLGVRSVCPNVTMDVCFTDSWYDEKAEKSAAINLINRGCKGISQHADSMGAPSACEEAGVPNVSYNGSMLETCPNSFIVSSRIEWVPYFEHIISTVRDGGTIEPDWSGNLETGSVKMTDVNELVAAPGTSEKLKEVETALIDGSIKVFDISTFTVNEKTVESYLADVDTDAAFTGDTEAISDGYFHESEYRCAPYFDLKIDGIVMIN